MSAVWAVMMWMPRLSRPVGYGDARRRGDGDGGGDARHLLAGDAGLGQGLEFLSAPPEHIGVAAFQAHHRRPMRA